MEHTQWGGGRNCALGNENLTGGIWAHRILQIWSNCLSRGSVWRKERMKEKENYIHRNPTNHSKQGTCNHLHIDSHAPPWAARAYMSKPYKGFSTSMETRKGGGKFFFKKVKKGNAFIHKVKNNPTIDEKNVWRIIPL